MEAWGSRCLGGGRVAILLAPPEGQSWEQTQSGQQGIEQKVVLPGGSVGFSDETVLHHRQCLGGELRRVLSSPLQRLLKPPKAVVNPKVSTGLASAYCRR